MYDNNVMMDYRCTDSPQRTFVPPAEHRWQADASNHHRDGRRRNFSAQCSKYRLRPDDGTQTSHLINPEIQAAERRTGGENTRSTRVTY